MSMSDIIGFVAKLLVYWFLAGLIAMLLSLGWVALTGGFAETLGELAINAVLERLPFPFDLIVASQIDPLSIILQFIIFIGLFLLFEARGST